MKKQLISVILAVSLALSISIPALALDPSDADSSTVYSTQYASQKATANPVTDIPEGFELKPGEKHFLGTMSDGTELYIECVSQTISGTRGTYTVGNVCTITAVSWIGTTYTAFVVTLSVTYQDGPNGRILSSSATWSDVDPVWSVSWDLSYGVFLDTYHSYGLNAYRGSEHQYYFFNANYVSTYGTIAFTHTS